MSRSSTKITIAVCWAVLMLDAGLCCAQNQTNAFDACMSDLECAKLCDRATDRFRSGQLQEALAAYQAAYALRSVPRLLINIGRVQQKMGRPADAIGSFRKYLTEPSPQSDADARVRAETWLHECEAALPPTPSIVPSSTLRPEQAKPVYKRAWFWGVLSGGAAAVALGIGLGVGLGTRPSLPTAPEGVPVIERSF